MKTLLTLVPVVCLLAVPYLGAQESGRDEAKAKADNTKVNKRDRNKAEPTADRAKDNTNDREIMKKIRDSIVSDKSLSTYAHNVKVVSQQGKVTLKGAVHSEEEKQSIQAKAAEVVGAENVTNDLSVKAHTGKTHKSKS